MATLIIVKKAILEMKDRTGSSLQAINKWCATNEKVRQRIRVLSLLLIVLHTILCFSKFCFSKKPRVKLEILTWHEKIKCPYHRLHIDLNNDTYIY